MRSISRSALIFGLCTLPAAVAWAGDDLDVTIRVIDRHETRLEGFNRIELPREFTPPAVTRVRAERPAEVRQEARTTREADTARRDFREQRSESERRQLAEKKETARESTREAMMEARERTREWKETRELRERAFRDAGDRGMRRP